jgi:2-keto-4-pentenoate hydratase/2-oxohepta-3-ene-1,7-dioic acid hydratase in catechol pathway
MKFCRFLSMEGPRFGLVESRDGQDVIVSELASPQMQVSAAGVPEQIVLPDPEDMTGSDEVPGSEEKPRAGKRIDPPYPLERARLLIPFPIISKILCVGRNYAAHVRELQNEMRGEPVIFSKPPSSLLASGGQIVRPSNSQRVDHEGELGILIGRRCHKMKDTESARDYILGYTIVNDVTARDLQKIDGQWTRAKGFDTFCPAGPIVNTELDPWSGVQVQTRVNGQLRQNGNTRDMMFDMDCILRYVSQFCTLLPGDLIATGTPEGVGPLLEGDVVEVSVEGIGILRNPVVNEPPE